MVSEMSSERAGADLAIKSVVVIEDWMRPNGQTPREICLAISTHLWRKGRRLHHHNEAARSGTNYLTRLLLDCLVSEPLRRAIFGTTFFIFDPWSIPWISAARLLDLRGISQRLQSISRKGPGCTTSKCSYLDFKKWNSTFGHIGFFNLDIYCAFVNRLLSLWI